MKTITIPEGVKEIGDWAFFNCESLHKVVLPVSVVAIGNRAFDKCSPMLEIIVPRGSYAESYAKANQINCKYPDADDWLKE